MLADSGYYASLKELIERAFESNQEQQVTLVGHGYGTHSCSRIVVTTGRAAVIFSHCFTLRRLSGTSLSQHVCHASLEREIRRQFCAPEWRFWWRDCRIAFGGKEKTT